MHRKRRAVLAAAAAAAATGICALAGPATASSSSPAPARRVAPLHLVKPSSTWNMAQSNNWSGYNQGALDRGKLFSSISGTWTVPTATQRTAGQAESSATWIGIGGGCLESSCTATDNTLIQAGTGQDVAANGKKSYYAWYELIPVPETTVSLPVSPGDTISVSIAQTVPGLWKITMQNRTTGKSYSTTVPYTSTMGSAEWIEETPLLIGTSGTGISSLPALSQVHFTGSTVNGSNAGLSTSQQMQLVGSNGQVLATPSAPNSAANAFNDCAYASSCPAP